MPLCKVSRYLRREEKPEERSGSKDRSCLFASLSPEIQGPITRGKTRQMTSSQAILSSNIRFAVAPWGFPLPCSYFGDDFTHAGPKQLLHTTTTALSGPETVQVNPRSFKKVRMNQRSPARKEIAAEELNAAGLIRVRSNLYISNQC